MQRQPISLIDLLAVFFLFMNVVSNFCSPTVQFFASYERDKFSQFTMYHEFSKSSNCTSGLNLLSYSWNMTVDEICGSFTLSFVEDNVNKNTLFDKIRALDIIIIKENEDSYFYGVITNRSIGANVSQKIITITGKSIEYLFTLYNINLDATALSLVETNKQNIDLKTELLKSDNKALALKTGLKAIFKNFDDVAKNLAKGVSSITIGEIIEHFYKASFSDIDYINTNNLEYNYPISSNLYTESKIDLMSYIQGLLPSPVYEIYGIHDKKRPTINIRQVPFDSTEWSNLTPTEVSPDYLTDYTINQNIDDIYTHFYAYVEGSVLDPSHYLKEQASQKGYQAGVVSAEKVARYGYKPLQLNFIGYSTGSTAKEISNTDNTLITTFNDLNKKMKTWYENLDLMFTGDLTIVSVNDVTNPKKGELINFLGGQFYVKSESHKWSYRDCIKITYGIDRGGIYTNGNWSELTNITTYRREFK